MDSDLLKRYEGIETDLLIRIAFLEARNYQGEAIETAKKVLVSRGITPDSSCVVEAIEGHRKYQETIKRDQEAIDRKPLPKIDCIFFFVCGMFFVGYFPAMFYIDYQKSKKGVRRTKESTHWLRMGLGTWFALNLLGFAITLFLLLVT
jgi:hypothetical protein